MDVQAIARIFRFGQDHPTHVYRIMAKNTFGHRVYRRSVDKESLFKRVIDKRHIKGIALIWTRRLGAILPSTFCFAYCGCAW